MPFGPGLLVTSAVFAGYGYWRLAFRQLTSAIRMENAGRLDEARDLLEGFLSNRNPLTGRGGSKIRCRLLLARLQRKMGDYESAAESARMVACAPGGAPELRIAALQVRADSLAWSGDLDGGLHNAREALRLASQLNRPVLSLEVTGLLTKILTWAGELPEAKELGQRLVESEGPTRLYGYLRLAEISRLQGKFNEAAELCRRAVEESERAAPTPAGRSRRSTWIALAHLQAARSAWAAGDRALAEEWLNTDVASQLPKPEAVAWHGIRAALAAERGASFQKELEKMCQRADTGPAGHGARSWSLYLKARVKMACGDRSGASPLLAQAIAAFPPGDLHPEILSCIRLCNPELETRGAAAAPAGFDTISAVLPPAREHRHRASTAITATVSEETAGE